MIEVTINGNGESHINLHGDAVELLSDLGNIVLQTVFEICKNADTEEFAARCVVSAHEVTGDAIKQAYMQYLAGEDNP